MGLGGGVVKAVRFSGSKDNVPEVWELTWEALVEALSRHEIRNQKDGAAWSPAVYKPGTTRGVKNVDQVSAAVFDLDHLKAEQVEAIRGKLQGMEYVLHSSFGHSAEDQRLRLTLPVNRPMTPTEWAKVRASLIKTFDLPADPATKDASRLYFLPACPPEASPFAEHGKGEWVKVDTLLQTKPVEVKPRAVPTSAYLDGDIDFDALRAGLRRVRKADSMALAKAILAGESLGEAGGRDLAIHRAASLMAFVFPSDTPVDACLELLRPSLEAMESEIGIEAELGKAEEKLTRAFRRKADEGVRTDAVKVALREQNLFQGEKTASDEEISSWVESLGSTVDGFEKKWIISKGRSYFVFSEGHYQKPIGADDLAVSLPRDFARNKAVDLYTLDAKGNTRKKTPAEILAKYGSVAREIRSSLSLQKSYYDEKTQTFHEAVCPLREDMKPVFHQDVQGYLEALGGDEKETLLDWICGVPDLTKQCAALFIEGDEGIGKTLLMMGLARLWTLGGPTEFGSLISDFNEAVATCPLVVVDEGFPKKKDFSINDELRRWTGSLDRGFRRKYVADATLSGSIRLLMVANNDRILDGMDEMNEADRKALSRRLIYIKATSAPRDYLESFPLEERDTFRTHKLAEHTLWLAKNRGVKNKGKRFLVEGKESSFHNKLTVENGLNPHLCEFVVGLIMDLNEALSRTYADRIMVGDGKVLVTTKLFTDEMAWKQRVPGTKTPTTQAIKRSLENMRLRQLQVSVKGERPYYNELKVDLLLAWVARGKDYDLEEVKRRIEAERPVLR